MKRLILLCLCVLLVALTSPAQATTTFSFTGTLHQDYLQFGSLWYDMQPGDTVNFRITLDETNNWSPESYFIEINDYARAGGNSIQFTHSLTDFTGQWYAPTFLQGELSTMYYDIANGTGLLKFNYESVGGGSEDDALRLTAFQNQAPIANLSIQATEMSLVPIPGAVWLLASGLIGLVGLRKRFQN